MEEIKKKKALVFQMINYSDKNVVEKIKKIENINKNNIAKNRMKETAYMSLYL